MQLLGCCYSIWLLGCSGWSSIYINTGISTYVNNSFKHDFGLYSRQMLYNPIPRKNTTWQACSHLWTFLVVWVITALFASRGRINQIKAPLKNGGILHEAIVSAVRAVNATSLEIDLCSSLAGTQFVRMSTMSFLKPIPIFFQQFPLHLHWSVVHWTCQRSPVNSRIDQIEHLVNQALLMILGYKFTPNKNTLMRHFKSSLKG